MLHRLRRLTRIFIPIAVLIVGFSLILVWLYPRTKKSMYDSKYLKTKFLVEAAWGILDYYDQEVKANAMSLDEAQQKAKETVKNLRYDQDGYFWINDTTPRIVMHPIQPELDGEDVSQYKDPNGKRLFAAMVNVCRKDGAGFVEYCWPKPGHEKPVAKISYVKLLPAWEWIIGSGIYLDDVDIEMGHLFYPIWGVVGLTSLLCLLLAYVLARRD